MRQQRNMSPMKEQDRTPEEQLSKVKIGSLPEKEFEIMIEEDPALKKYRGVDQEDTRNVLQRPRRAKEQR